MRTTMIKVCQVLALLALAVCVSVPIVVCVGKLSFSEYLRWFNLASLLWFLTAPLWIVPRLFGKEWEKAGRLAKLRRRR